MRLHTMYTTGKINFYEYSVCHIAKLVHTSIKPVDLTSLIEVVTVLGGL